MMIGHYFVGALRALRQQKAISLINIACLALGLAAFIVAYSVVRYLETSERHFANADRTYVVSTELTFPTGERPLTTLVTPLHAAKYVKEEFPELEAVVRVQKLGDMALVSGAEKAFVRGVAADREFLQVFSLRFVAGDAGALMQPRSVVISEAVAQRLFGSKEAIGKRVTLRGATDATVTGVFESLPKSSSFDFELLASWDTYEATLIPFRPPGTGRAPSEQWLALGSTTTYALVPYRPASRERFFAGLATFANKYVPVDQRSYYKIDFKPVALSSLRIAKLDQMLFSNLGREVSITTILLALGGLILGLACINYANLTTAQATDRFKEIGTRRVMGATTRHVLLQSLAQTGVHVALALTVAVLCIVGIAPVIDQGLDVDIRKIALSDGVLWSFIPLLVLAVTTVGGAYAALVSARVTPSRALRASSLATPVGISRVVMVGIQFAAACSLLVVVVVMDRQTQALKSSMLGDATGSVIVLGNNLPEARVSFATYKQAGASIPGVEAVSGSSSTAWSTDPDVITFSRGAAPGAETVSVHPHGIDHDFFATLQIPLLAGRTLDPKFASDLPGAAPTTSGPQSTVVDRDFVQSLGLTPNEALGEMLYYPAVGQVRPLRIVGVVENRPLTVQNYGASGNIFQLAGVVRRPVLRVSTQNLSGTLAALRDQWSKLAPNIPFDARFLDTAFDQGYRPFRTISNFLSGLVLLAIGIAVVGLVAMTLHEIRHRFHEMAIRKTLGARTAIIARGLMGTFSVPVLLGNLIALPLAYAAVQGYLSMFSSRIELSMWPFVLGFVVTSAIALLAVAFQTVSAARLKPAALLRYE